MIKLRHLWFLFGVAFFAACVEDRIESPFPDATREYFPLNVGASITYQIDSIVFDDAPGGNQTDTSSFQLKEEVASLNLNDNGDSIYYLHRYRRANETEAWRLTDVWTSQLTHTEALRTEENLKFRKLSLPLKYGKRWSPTAYIDPELFILIGTENVLPYQYWEAEVLSFDSPGNIGDFTFPTGQVMVVEQTNTDEGSMKRYVQETYVRNIGLVERHDSILDSRCLALGDFEPCFGKPWIEHASKGYILSQVMIDHQ